MRRKIARAIARVQCTGYLQWRGATGRQDTAPITMRVRGHSLAIRPATPDLDVALTSLGKELRPLFSSVPRLHHNFIIDAGGYIGTTAIALAEKYQDATIVSLEPDEENFALLTGNTANHPNIIPLQLALSDRPGEASLKDPGAGPWGFTIVASHLDRRHGPIRREVTCITVDQLMTRFGVSGIDIFKIDVEGSELSLFNSDNTAWIDKTRAIFIELHDRIAPGCTKAFENATLDRQNVKTSGEKILSVHNSENLRIPPLAAKSRSAS